MNTLYFVRFNNSEFDQIVYCVTALGPTEAILKGFDGIAEFCRADFKCNRVEIICMTSDEVVQFEPV